MKIARVEETRMARKMGIEVTHFMPELSISKKGVSYASISQDK